MSQLKEPCAKRQKTNPEPDFIAFALTHTDHEKFLEYFKNEDETIFKNYLRLATETGLLESFQGNPLAFIVLNQPACCYPIACDYIMSVALSHFKSFDNVLQAIANDCIQEKRVRLKETAENKRLPRDDPRKKQADSDGYLFDQLEFTPEQNERYRALDPEGEFWGGYAYLREDGYGFIRLYSPEGSAKWCFWEEDGKVVVDLA